MNSKKNKIVNDYLYMNDFNFIDKLMVRVIEEKENYILQEISKVSFKIGAYVDEKRLKEWIKMCESLQNVPSEHAKDIAIQSKINRLENKINSLILENEALKEVIENEALKEVIENE